MPKKVNNEEIKDFCDTKHNVSFRPFNKIDVTGDNASPLLLSLLKQLAEKYSGILQKFLINKEGEFVRGFVHKKT